ncbi:hypothetical protein Y695_04157 [Hydrogenophaga sp. T4]|nr:hypothetical protein Y695_04157 [Hydrogenophaga sp. T4]
MARAYSLAYLSSHRCTPPEAVRVAAANGYQFVGLRLWPNAPGAPQQFLLGEPEVLKETQAVMADTGVGIFDVEIIRIGEDFDPHTWDALYGACAALKAKAILIAGDDPIESRLTQNYARLCEVMQPYGLTADLEFMPWTAVKDAKSALRSCRTQVHRPTPASWSMRCTSAARTPRWMTSAPSRANCCTTRRSATPWPARTSRSKK